MVRLMKQIVIGQYSSMCSVTSTETEYNLPEGASTVNLLTTGSDGGLCDRQISSAYDPVANTGEPVVVDIGGKAVEGVTQGNTQNGLKIVCRVTERTFVVKSHDYIVYKNRAHTAQVKTQVAPFDVHFQVGNIRWMPSYHIHVRDGAIQSVEMYAVVSNQTGETVKADRLQFTTGGNYNADHGYVTHKRDGAGSIALASCGSGGSRQVKIDNTAAFDVAPCAFQPGENTILIMKSAVKSQRQYWLNLASNTPTYGYTFDAPFAMPAGSATVFDWSSGLPVNLTSVPIIATQTGKQIRVPVGTPVDFSAAIKAVRVLLQANVDYHKSRYRVEYHVTCNGASLGQYPITFIATGDIQAAPKFELVDGRYECEGRDGMYIVELTE